MSLIINKPTTNVKQNFSEIEQKTARENIGAVAQKSFVEHITNSTNPHKVTAEQVGAYTKAETEEVINDAISGDVGGWLGNMTVAEINALTGQKKGDSVTVKDSGIVDPGHVAVSMGDDLMWAASKSVWEKKIVRDKGFVEFEGELRFG